MRHPHFAAAIQRVFLGHHAHGRHGHPHPHQDGHPHHHGPHAHGHHGHREDQHGLHRHFEHQPGHHGDQGHAEHRHGRHAHGGHHHHRHASAGGDWFSGSSNGRGDADGFGGDGRGFTRSRKVSSDDLQLMLLGLLEQNPSHGYELIKALGALSNGFYTPSPGMVYPALTYLEELGYATVEQEGAKKRYHLSEPGRAHLEANRDRLTLMFNKLKHVARKMDWMRQAWSGEPRATGPEGEDARTGWVPEFVAARHGLKRALLDRTDASPAEQRRIAAILARATDEITGNSGC